MCMSASALPARSRRSGVRPDAHAEKSAEKRNASGVVVSCIVWHRLYQPSKTVCSLNETLNLAERRRIYSTRDPVCRSKEGNPHTCCIASQTSRACSGTPWRSAKISSAA